MPAVCFRFIFSYGLLSLCAGAHDEFFRLQALSECSRGELAVCAGFGNFEAFADKAGEKLPKAFKLSVAVKDGADVFTRAIGGNIADIRTTITRESIALKFLLFSYQFDIMKKEKAH